VGACYGAALGHEETGGVPLDWIAQVHDGAELLRLARRLVDMRPR
jgi:hypothetical protein